MLKHPACFVEVPPGLDVARCAGVSAHPGGLSRDSPGFQSRADPARSSQRHFPHPRPGRSRRVRRVLKHPACCVEFSAGLDDAHCAGAPAQPGGLSRSSPGFQSRADPARSSQQHFPHPRPGRPNRVRRVLKHPACFVEVRPVGVFALCVGAEPGPRHRTKQRQAARGASLLPAHRPATTTPVRRRWTRMTVRGSGGASPSRAFEGVSTVRWKCSLSAGVLNLLHATEPSEVSQPCERGLCRLIDRLRRPQFGGDDP